MPACRLSVEAYLDEFTDCSQAIRRSLKGDKEQRSHHQSHNSIGPKSASAIVPPRKVIKALYDYEPQNKNGQELGGSWYGISGECSDTFSLDAVGFEVYLKEGGGRISRYRINIMLEQIVLYPAYTIRVRLERYSTTLISTLTKIPQPGLLAVGYVTMTLSSIGHRVKKPLASSL